MDPIFGVSNEESDQQAPAFAAQPRSSPAPAAEGAVFDAAQKGDVQGLKAALAAGGSTEEADAVSKVSDAPGNQTARLPHIPSSVQDGNTSLIAAILNGHVEVARVLMTSGANAAARTKASAAEQWPEEDHWHNLPRALSPAERLHASAFCRVRRPRPYRKRSAHQPSRRSECGNRCEGD